MGLYQAERENVYLEVNAILGAQIPPADFTDRLLSFEKLNMAGSVLVWASIFFVKLSFVTFFRKLVSRIRPLELWWRVVVIVLVVLGPTCSFAVFVICPNFSPDFREICTDLGMTIRERDYTIFLTVSDILTDLMIISIPIALLWRVQINLQRKLALGVILCLSAFMIVIAIVRVGLSQIYSNLVQAHITDTVWLVFWQALEAATAIIMVSITAFRALLGQEPSKRGYEMPSGPSNINSRTPAFKFYTRRNLVGRNAVSSPSAVGYHMEKAGKALPRERGHDTVGSTSSVDDLVEIELKGKSDLASIKHPNRSARSQTMPETFV